MSLLLGKSHYKFMARRPWTAKEIWSVSKYGDIFFWSWLQCRHWITLIWNWPSTAVDWMAARRRRRVKSSPTYLLWAALHCWRTWPFADVRLLVFHARTNILVWASRVLIFRRGFLLQGRWKGEGGHAPSPFQFLPDQLTLFQLGRGDYARHITYAPPDFWTLHRLCFEWVPCICRRRWVFNAPITRLEGLLDLLRQ